MQQDEQSPPISEQRYYSSAIRPTRNRGQRRPLLRRDRIVIICGLLAVLVTIATVIGIVIANNATLANQDAQTSRTVLTVTAGAQTPPASSGGIPTITKTATPSDIQSMTRATATAAASPTQQPGITPTPSPTATATPTPSPTATATPSPTAPPGRLFITFTAASASVQGNATISIHTLAGTALRIRVIWCNGRMVNNPTLKAPANADSNGNYTWNWPASSANNACTGRADATVIATHNGQTATNSSFFMVQ